MDNDVHKIVQYQMPPVWMEWGGYGAALGMFYAAVLTQNVWVIMALAAMLMYWNYRLFAIIREYVTHVNASEMSKLLMIMAEAEINKQKDGTFQDNECLTKEHDSEGTEGD